MKCSTKILVLGCFVLISYAAQSAQFSIVVIPDTQWYAENDTPFFEAQTQWVVDNRIEENIIYVAHLGDLKDGAGASGCNNQDLGGGFTEWDYVSQALDLLENPSISPLTSGLPNGIPYGTVPGNHDFDDLNITPGGGPCPNYNPDAPTGRDLTLFDARLGDMHFNSFGYYGGTRPVDVAQELGLSGGDATGDSYTLFEYCGIEFVAINLSYRATQQAGAPVAIANPEMQWTNDLLATNPNRLGIITSHFFLEENAGMNVNDFGSWAALLYGEISANPNLFMMLGAHRRGEAWRTEGRGVLEDVQVLLSNYQAVQFPGPAPPDFFTLNGSFGSGDSAFMRIMRFDTDMGTVNVETFAPKVRDPADATPLDLTDPGSYLPNRDVDLVSTFSPMNGTFMNRNTASNFSFSFENYGTTSSACSVEPVDIALAMDRSGSMNGASADPGSGSKLDVVKAAADLFIDQIAMDGVHRLGLSQFNTAVVPFAPDVPFGPVNTVNAVSAHSAIASIVGGGGTDILDGLDGGVDRLDVTYPNNRQAVVLFTDGRHNSPTTLLDGPLRDALDSRINSLSLSAELYSIGFGTSISDVPLVDATGLNDGWHINEVDSMSVAKDFSLVATAVMDNVVLSDPVFSLQAGETQSHKIGVSGADNNLTFVVHWINFDQDLVATNIVPPGGGCAISSSVSNPVTPQASGINYRVVRVNLPYDCNGSLEHAGDWTVEITGSEQIRKRERVDILGYASSDIELGSSLKLTKRRLDISASLLGDSLQKAQFTAYILPPLPESDDSTEHDELGSDPGTVSSIPKLELVPRSPITIDLKVTGMTSTSIDAEGHFDTAQKGLYQVRVVAQLIDASGQEVRREKVATFYSETAKGPSRLYWWLISFAILMLIFVFWKHRRKAIH